MQKETVTWDHTGEVVDNGPENRPGLVEQEGSVIVCQPKTPQVFKESRRLPALGRTSGLGYLRLESPHDSVNFIRANIFSSVIDT